MARFTYKALNESNIYATDSIEARTKKSALKKLEAKKLLVVSIKKYKSKASFLSKSLALGMTAQDKIFFTRNIHTMLDSGIPLDQAIQTTADQTTSTTLKEILNDIYVQVRSGQTFYSSLDRHKKYFSSFYINVIKVGELSGKLDEAMLHLLEQQEKDYDLRIKSTSAMIYPAIILSALVVMVTLMMIFVIPRVVGVLTEYHVGLPFTTRAVMWTSNFIVRYGIILLPVLIVIGFGLKKLASRGRGKKLWDSFILNIPKVGIIIREFNQARFARAMSSLIKSGISFHVAIGLGAKVSNNSMYQAAIEKTIPLIQKGIPLSELLAEQSKLFTPMAVRMIALGEKTGKLDHMFGKLADFYEKSVRSKVSNLSTVIEPALLIITGLIVAFVAISILTPIWKFSDTI